MLESLHVPRKLTNWLNSYIDYTRHLEAPLALHFWSGVCTIAGALRGKVWIDMGYWKWRPNFFVIIVAPPGIANKSTTIEVGMELLREIEGIHFGPNSATWQALTTAFAESTEIVQLHNGQSYEMSAITLAISELGTFFDPKNSEMVDVLVDLWDGKQVPWRRATKSEGDVSVPNPWIHIIGATTPAWIEEHFPEYAIGGGFTSRTLFIYADHKRQLIAYPGDHQTSEDLKLKADLINDLAIIANLRGPFTLTPEAKTWGTKWYEQHWAQGVSGNDRKAGYLSRKQTQIHKVAMIHAAAERDTMFILPEDLMIADKLVTSLELDMERVFERVTSNTYSRYMISIINYLRTQPKQQINRVLLWKYAMNMMSWDDFKATIEGLIQANVLTQRQMGADLILTLHLQDKGDQFLQTIDDIVSVSGVPPR